MRNIVFLFLLTVSLISRSTLLNAAQLTGVVSQVADGDTYWLDSRDQGRVKIRCNGIDAPELKQAHGSESCAALSKVILNKSVTVKYTEKDKYGRYLGDTYVLFQNKLLHVERAMVLYGHAWHFVKYSDSEVLHEAEMTARAERRGLWAADNPTPPWEYRHRPVHVDVVSGARYWVRGDVIHNSSCRYYGNTKNGYYTETPTGKNCGICGGAGYTSTP